MASNIMYRRDFSMQDLTDEFCCKTDEIGENSGTAAAVPAVPGASSLCKEIELMEASILSL